MLDRDLRECCELVHGNACRCGVGARTTVGASKVSVDGGEAEGTAYRGCCMVLSAWDISVEHGGS